MKLNIVPARTGLDWVKLGLRTFRQQPMALAGVSMLLIAIMYLVGMVPVVGRALALWLAPAATLAMMVASAEAVQGRFPKPSVLLVAFRSGSECSRRILVLGGLYVAGFLAILGVPTLIDGGVLAGFYLGEGSLSREIMETAAVQQAALLHALLSVLLSMTFWHAPGLVYWHGISPVKALFFSFVACGRNMKAFLMFGLGWLFVLMTGLLLSLILAAILILLGMPQEVAKGMLSGLQLLVTAMFLTSIVFTFRDCFLPPAKPSSEESHDEQPAPAPGPH